MTKDMKCKKNCDHCNAVFFRDKRNTWAYWAKAKFCSRQCSADHGAKIRRNATPTLSDAFWKRVEKSGPNDCWAWAGSTDRDGYPLVTFRSKQMRATRVALMVSGIKVDKNQHACHLCGNSWCCNPAHLYAGSPKENNSDKKMHGTHRKGESIYCSKLTEDDVRSIRGSSLTNVELSEAFGVSPSNIHHVRTGKTWRHVQ